MTTATAKKFFLIILLCILKCVETTAQTSLLVTLGNRDCNSNSPNISITKDPLTATPALLTSCDISTVFSSPYGMFISYNPKNNKIYLANIMSGNTDIWTLDVGLPYDIQCPSLSVVPTYSYDFTSNHFEFDNIGNLWSLTNYNNATGQAVIDKIDVLNGTVTDSRTVQFPAGNFPDIIQSGDLVITPNGRMFALMGFSPSKLFEIIDYNTTAATAVYLTETPKLCYALAYINGQLVVAGSQNSCYYYKYDIATGNLSEENTYQNGLGPFDNTSITPSLGTTKELISSTIINSNTADLVYEIYLKNTGNTTLNNINITDDLAKAFGAGNVSNISTSFVAGQNPANLTINPFYNGSTDVNLLNTGQTLPNFGTTGSEYFAKIRLSFRATNLVAGTTYFNSATAQSFMGAGPSFFNISDLSNNGSSNAMDPNNNGYPGDAGEDEPTPFTFCWAAVSITASSNDICKGSPVTFTANPVQPGTNPIYKWQKNGVDVGSSNSVYTDAALANGDKIICFMQSNDPCVTSPNVFSNTITLTVTDYVQPFVTISTPSLVVCKNTSVQFTAISVNAGTNPVYQWQKNGITAGNNSNIYTDASLNDNDIISCSLFSSAKCLLPAIPNSQVKMTVINPPNISISADANNVCKGTALTFSATVLNSSANAFYKWKVNGIDAGTNSSFYKISTLKNGDVISCIYSDDNACIISPGVFSNVIAMQIKEPLTPSLIVQVSANNICAKTPVTFTALTNGMSVVYDWKKNGVSTGINSNKYYDNTLLNGDKISCSVIISDVCFTKPDAESTPVEMIVKNNPEVILDKTPAICIGKILDAGNFISYLWNTGSVQRSIAVNDPGKYFVQVTDANGCNASDTVNILKINLLPVNFIASSATLNCITETAVLAPNKNFVSYLWSTGSSDKQIVVAQQGVYSLHVTDENGCKAKADIQVKQVLCSIIIPNTFTPNNDGINETWKIKYIDKFPFCSVEIYNRYGQQVYGSAGYKIPWNGIYKGKILPIGTYYYIIDLRNGEVFTGYVTIMK